MKTKLSFFIAILLIFSQTCLLAKIKSPEQISEPPVAPFPAPQSQISGEAAPYSIAEPNKTDGNFYSKDSGIFNLDTNADISGQLGLFGIYSIKCNVVFSDPYYLGRNLGLADDAFVYKLGLGLVCGNLISVPFCAETVVYLKEKSLFGLSPYVGGGFNFNLVGNDYKFGGFGATLYGGILLNIFSQYAKTGLSIGYESFNVENFRHTNGIFIAVTQPVKL